MIELDESARGAWFVEYQGGAGIDRGILLLQAAMDYLEESKAQASSCGNVEASECVDKSMRELNSALVWARQSKAEGAS